MSNPDVLSELARIMHKEGPLSDRQRHAVQRARDEIVALRKCLHEASVCEFLKRARAEALEEAAQTCEHKAKPVQAAQWQAACLECAAVIRLLKDALCRLPPSA